MIPPSFTRKPLVKKATPKPTAAVLRREFLIMFSQLERLYLKLKPIATAQIALYNRDMEKTLKEQRAAQ